MAFVTISTWIALSLSVGGALERRISDIQYDGRTSLTFDNKDVFTGDFHEGKPYKGSFRYYQDLTDGQEYSGHVNEYYQPRGAGTMIYATYKNWENRIKYEGNWVDGKPHGLGSMEYENGEIKNGLWHDGLFIEKVSFAFDPLTAMATCTMDEPNESIAILTMLWTIYVTSAVIAATCWCAQICPRDGE